MSGLCLFYPVVLPRTGLRPMIFRDKQGRATLSDYAAAQSDPFAGNSAPRSVSIQILKAWLRSSDSTF